MATFRHFGSSVQTLHSWPGETGSGQLTLPILGLSDSSWFCGFAVSSAFGEGTGTPLQYSCLENPMDGGAWWAAVHGVTKSQTRLSNSTFTFYFDALQKEMATHSSVLAWRIPGTEEPGRLPFMGSHRVRHDWSDLAAAASALVSVKWAQMWA